MPKYTYRARDKSGQLVTGSAESGNEYEVASGLKDLGYSIVEIRPETASSGGLQEYYYSAVSRISRQEIIVFTRQLATLLRTGNTLTSSLDNVAEQVKNQKLRGVIKQVMKDVQSGMSFSKAVAKHPQVFDGFFVSMVKIGEAGGLLDDVLERLASLGADELEIRSRVQSSLIYPVVLIGLSLAVVAFVLVAVLPNFVSIFEASQAKLPVPTKIILGLSWALRNYWYLAAGGLVLCVFWLKWYISTPEGRYRIDGYILKSPLFGELYLKVMISRFSRAMAALTKTGVPFHEGLAVVENTIPNTVLRRTFIDIRNRVNVGQGVTEAFRSSGIFPPMVIQLISSGEKSGHLDEMFSEVASFYEPEVEYTLRNFTSLLEPFLLLVMGAIVAFIALSVLLPIFNLIKIIKA
ncbi:MAG TPA: type II secretion system F family protein [Candidatus Omnitrophota bacterium]|nr:type II secretion system F family protein [Candidatus Omnitrophota bacterium]HOX09335.1 type II secretion system F family protein [Candidatus Omnitrophota bacterium]